MSRRSRGAVDTHAARPRPPSTCAKVLYCVWRVGAGALRHGALLSLVVAYCVAGAATFSRLEAPHEREVRLLVPRHRVAAAAAVWELTEHALLLHDTNWTAGVDRVLRQFEAALLLEMRTHGWDGSEDPTRAQWTFTGALFYSIIVITTIGYGHIAPKTQTGKVVTIFYAILGIPLMLLCLSNLGDVMASSFRFLYWRVCCYVCTRPPRRPRHHLSASGSRRSMRAVRGPLPASASAPRRTLERAHSDTDCRYRDSGYSSSRRVPGPRPPRPRVRPRSQPPRTIDYEFDSDESSPSVPAYSHQDYDVDFPRVSLPLRDLEAALQELEEHQRRSGGGGSRDVRDLREVDLHNYRERRLRRALTVDDSRPARRWTPELPPPARHRPPPPRPVPIWLCVLLVASYIVAGTFLFTSWEGWAPLDAAYFCFITLTTIGFGDFVPAQSSAGARAGAVHSIALCSLYLLFGIALLAMSFNLVQEEVRGNVAALAARLGIIRQRDH